MLRDFAGTANSRWRNTLGSTKGLAGERSYWECFCPGVKRLNKSEGGAAARPPRWVQSAFSCRRARPPRCRFRSVRVTAHTQDSS